MSDWTPLFKGDYSYSKPFNIFSFVKDAVIKRNESIDFFLAADRGMGKSATAMSLAMMLDKKFTVDHWCFTSDRFIELITSKQRKGTVVVFDDVGTSEGSSSRKWQKDEAHDLADIMQVNRTDGIITIGTSLQMGRMELRLRDGFRVLCQPIRKLTNQDTGNGMAIDVEMRLRTVDVFEDRVRHKLWRYASGGRIKYVRLFHPPVGIWNEYQIVRKAFLEDIKARREKKEAEKTERAEKKEANAAEKLLHATDKDWAKHVHIRGTDFKIFKNILKRVDTEWDASSPNTSITKTEFTQLIMDGTGTQRPQASNRVANFEKEGIVQKKRSFDAAGKPDKEYTYHITDKGRDMLTNAAIPGSKYE